VNARARKNKRRRKSGRWAAVEPMYVRVIKNKERLKSHRTRPRCELLRLRQVLQWLGISRDYLELLEKEGRITPFRKSKGAKAWYRAYELCSDFEIGLPTAKRPRTLLVRRADVLCWLGVPAAEFESWVRYGIILGRHLRGPNSKAYYATCEIETNVLGIPQLE